jgi:hypothetical protein
MLVSYAEASEFQDLDCEPNCSTKRRWLASRTLWTGCSGVLNEAVDIAHFDHFSGTRQRGADQCFQRGVTQALGLRREVGWGGLSRAHQQKRVFEFARKASLPRLVVVNSR